jgi:hypothetical protein
LDIAGIIASAVKSRDGIVAYYQGCGGGIEYYQDTGRYYTSDSGYIPLAGDVFFYGLDHTGLVLAYDSYSNMVYTIEGNVDNMVKILKHPLSYFTSYGSNGGSSYGLIPQNYSSSSGRTQ